MRFANFPLTLVTSIRIREILPLTVSSMMLKKQCNPVRQCDALSVTIWCDIKNIMQPSETDNVMLWMFLPGEFRPTTAGKISSKLPELSGLHLWILQCVRHVMKELSRSYIAIKLQRHCCVGIMMDCRLKNKY